jgi:hypothetical protein
MKVHVAWEHMSLKNWIWWPSKAKFKIFKLNKLVCLIFRNIKFWDPIRAEGCTNLTEYQNGVQMTGTNIDEFTININ